MGYIRHHAILVTGTDPYIQKAHQRATEIFGEPQGPFDDSIAEVSEVTPQAVNGYRTFMVAPDGSKEWWDHSDRGNGARDTFVKWLKEDGGLYWAEVQYADDDGVNKVTRTNADEEEE